MRLVLVSRGPGPARGLPSSTHPGRAALRQSKSSQYIHSHPRHAFKQNEEMEDEVKGRPWTGRLRGGVSSRGSYSERSAETVPHPVLLIPEIRARYGPGMFTTTCIILERLERELPSSREPESSVV